MKMAELGNLAQAFMRGREKKLAREKQERDEMLQQQQHELAVENLRIRQAELKNQERNLNFERKKNQLALLHGQPAEETQVGAQGTAPTAGAFSPPPDQNQTVPTVPSSVAEHLNSLK